MARAPSPRSTGPPIVVSHRPIAAAMAMVTTMAISSWRSVTRPAAATRSGPARSGVSAPLRKSDRSLDRFAVICRTSATARQPTAVSRRNGAPMPSAAPRPTSTPLTAAGSVAGRMARSQIRAVDGRASMVTDGAGSVRSPACASRGTHAIPRGPRRSCSTARSRCRRTPGARPDRLWRRGMRT